jgi:hypothetical protein
MIVCSGRVELDLDLDLDTPSERIGLLTSVLASFYHAVLTVRRICRVDAACHNHLDGDDAGRIGLTAFAGIKTN